MIEGRRLQPGISECELDEVAAVLIDAFARYPVKLTFTVDSLRAMFADDVVPEACGLVREGDGEVVGVGLAALRGDRGRVAVMGVTRAAARTGVGRLVGEWLLEGLVEAHAREVVLEALTTNASALALYEALGFERRRRLVGFVRPAGGEPIAAEQWDEALADGSEPDSWQLGQVVASAREQADLISVAAVVPEAHAVARLLRGTGFEEAEIDQFELVLPLEGTPVSSATAS